MKKTEILHWRHSNIIRVILLVVLIFSFGMTFNKVRDRYTQRNIWEQAPWLQQLYNSSQYMSKAPTVFIPDETVNTYAGIQYIKGINPILIAPDTPPLGRYLIGLSALLFGNEHIIILFFYCLSFILLFIVGIQALKSVTYALLVMTGCSFEKLLSNQLVYSPLLDIMQLAFLLASLYLFTKGFCSKKFTYGYFLGASIALGCFIAIKFFIIGAVVVFSWFLVIVMRKEWHKLLLLILSLPFSIAILLLSYIKALFSGYSFLHFLGIQKWVYLYHQSQLILPLSVWPLIFFNRWYVWFGNNPIISDDQWNIIWPMITMLSIATVCMYVFKKIPHQKEIEPYFSWIVCYVTFLSIGQTTSRYLIILIPFLYVVSAYGIQQGLLIIKQIKNKKYEKNYNHH